MRRHCVYCGDEFDPYERDDEGRTYYCSDECRNEDALDEAAFCGIDDDDDDDPEGA